MRIRSTIATKPAYLFLLPLFFVFHGYVENYDLIPLQDIALLFLVYLGYSIAILLLFLLIYRNLSRAGLISLVVMFFYFFFGYIYDTIYAAAPKSFFSKYSVILVFIFIITATTFIFLFFRKRPFNKLNKGINIFLLLLLLVDVAWLIGKGINQKNPADDDFSKSFSVCDTCSKPDIYLIITDGYPGDQQLTELLNFDNSAFKNELRKRKFLCPTSISNYNYTPFSIGSMFKMDYLQGIKGIDTDPQDLSICFGAMREARMFRVLKQHGYRLHNLSLFNIYDQPSPFDESLLPDKTKFITAQTLINRVEKNILYNMTNFFSAKKKQRMYLAYNNNVNAYNSTLEIAGQKAAQPHFTYTHLEMPHYPYYFNKDGIANTPDKLAEGKDRDTALFKEYLQYTNKKILSLVDTIFSRSARPPIILLVSDHGLREFSYEVDIKYHFINSVAIYLPSQNYSSFYNGISNINLMRALLNVQFNQKFPMLRDSTSIIKIK